MQLGAQRERALSSLGHFGMGLKAASFSQASQLTVLSRSSDSVGVGRRIHRESTNEGFAVETLDDDQVELALDVDWNDFTTRGFGTIILWDEIPDVSQVHGRDRHELIC